jgi:nuclear pore complex protein Nup98-Nup96
LSDNDEDSEDATTHPAGIRLKRAGYYTIPTMSELANLTDCDGNCNVENFTIGRTGYGNIFFPGVTNIRNMNFDEIVFFRRKEVIVYPDDDKKPQLGDGLNRRAQVTLDKVWPVDKTKQEAIKSPEKLAQLNYEDKLQKACIKLGARFIEYRAETGSWVFRVDHFSKYGLDDSDEEEDASTILGRKDVKKLKVVGPPQPVKSPVVTLPAKVQLHGDMDTSPVPPSQKQQQQQMSDSSNMEDNSGSDSMLQLSRLSAPPSKVQMMKAALFTMETEDMDTSSAFDVTNIGKESRPIILEPRPTILERRDKFIEDIAHSMLTGNRSKGLGGSFSIEPTAALTSSLLLRSQYLSHSGLANSNTPSARPHPSTKLSRYTLQGGYDKYVALSTQGVADTVKPPVVPQHVGRLLPFSEAILGPERMHCFADAGLFMGRTFHVGWGVDWSLANIGNSLSNASLLVTSIF